MPKHSINNPKVALITGAARRIGAEIARILHQNGMNVVLHYIHSKAEAIKLCSLLNEQRANSAIVLKADLSTINSIKPFIKEAASTWGRLDILINNASCFYKTPVGKVTAESWGTLMDTNLKAPFFLAQAAVPHLKKHKGSIINIVDIHSERPMQEYSVYSISKAGLSMATKTLARELGPFGIRVNSVSPGAIIWPEGENALSAKIQKTIVSHTALKRSGNAHAIAEAVLFLAKDASYVTGQDIAVDGGRSLFL
jgi:pteridine reductase